MYTIGEDHMFIVVAKEGDERPGCVEMR